MSSSQARITFSENLQYCIIKSKKQQKEIALELGIPLGTFSMWCSGRAVPKGERLFRLAEYFNVSVMDLMKPRKEPFSKPNSSKKSDMDIIKDRTTYNMVKDYYKLSPDQKRAIRNLIELFRIDSIH